MLFYEKNYCNPFLLDCSNYLIGIDTIAFCLLDPGTVSLHKFSYNGIRYFHFARLERNLI